MSEIQSNIVDYVKWRGDLLFSQIPVSDVDALAFTQLAYMYMDKAFEEKSEISLEKAMNQTPGERYEGDEFAKARFAFSQLLAKTPRYKDLILADYVNEIDTDSVLQFAAVTIKISDALLYIAYRGTSDEIVGWREDFNLSYLSPIPAQKRALEYLQKVALKYPQQALLLGGHSKGGNLAMYAGIHFDQDQQDRIACIYNFDGPGFGKCKDSNALLQKYEHKIKSFVPKNAVVGVLLGANLDHKTVDSNSLGIFQHNALSWNVLGNCFVDAERDAASKQFEEDIQSFVSSLDEKTSQHLISLFFDAVEKSGAELLSDLAKNIQIVKNIYESSKSMDGEQQKLIEKLMRIVFSYAINTLGDSLKDSKIVEYITNLFQSDANKKKTEE